MISVAAVSAVR